MLKKIRIVLAAINLAGFFLLFLQPVAPDVFPWLEWLPKVQVIPGILSGYMIIFALIILFTLFFGRVYCSILCPLGLFQDIVALSASSTTRLGFMKAKPWLRATVMVIFIASLVAGLPALFSLFEPYSIFGRIIACFISSGRAIWRIVCGDTISFSIGFMPMMISFAMFAVISFMAIKHGRLWCNTMCPVGTILGYLSRFALFKIYIDKNACVRCGLCERICKSSCIDSSKYRIDASRCVVCFTCIKKCKHNAITFTHIFNNNIHYTQVMPDKDKQMPM